MKFIADFHVHSKYSRATSKNSDLENLYISAQLKGINVIGTGDITHPGWFSEIEKKLSPAEGGLFKPKKEIAKPLNDHIPGACRGDVRFILTSEISSIYKKNGKTSKNKQREKPDIKINIGVKEKRVTEQGKKSKETEKKQALNEQQKRAIHHLEGPLIIEQQTHGPHKQPDTIENIPEKVFQRVYK